MVADSRKRINKRSRELPFLFIVLDQFSHLLCDCVCNKGLFFYIRSVLFHNDYTAFFMKTIKIGKHNVTYYDTIAELPIVRFHIYNKMLLVDSGVGSDIADFDSHLERVMAYIQKDNKENAIKEIQNLRQNFYIIQQSLSPKYMAFSALIKEIDGRPCDDLSDEGLKAILKLFASEAVKNVNEPLSEAKKKSKRICGNIFRRFSAILRKKNFLI